MGIKARRVEGGSEIKSPGDWCWADYAGERSAIIHSCPCGCGQQSLCWILRPDGSKPVADRQAWTWNGSEDAITLDPSILINICPNRWHGWLRNGEFVT